MFLPMRFLMFFAAVNHILASGALQSRWDLTNRAVLQVVVVGHDFEIFLCVSSVRVENSCESVSISKLLRREMEILKINFENEMKIVCVYICLLLF